MSELMEALEARVLLGGNPFDAPELSITFGNSRIRLLQDEAPRAVQSFMELRDQGKLRDMIIHKANPGGKVARAGLFRETTEGLEFVARTKRIDAGRSLPTVAGTVGFMRDPDNPNRTTGEIVFNRVDRPLVRSKMVVFATYTDLDVGRLFFNLSGQEGVERPDLLRSVPAESRSIFEDIRFLDFGLGNIAGTPSFALLGGFASADSAEWITLHNTGNRIEKFEVQLRTGNADHDSINARWFVRPGKRRLVQLHIGANLADVNHQEFFASTQGVVVVARGVRPSRAYTAIVHTSGGLTVRLDRLERDPDSGVLRPMRIKESGFLGFGEVFFAPIDFDNAGAGTRIVFNNFEAFKTSTVRITGTNDLNETIRVRWDIPAGRPLQVHLDRIEQFAGRITQLRVEAPAGSNVRLLLLDGQKDFSSVDKGVAVLPGMSFTSFFQQSLSEGTPLRFFVYNPTSVSATVTPVVSLIRCTDPDDCPADPPEVPRLEPFEVPAFGMASFPVFGELPVFDQDFVFRMISVRTDKPDRPLSVHLYFDPAMLDEL